MNDFKDQMLQQPMNHIEMLKSECAMKQVMIESLAEQLKKVEGHINETIATYAVRLSSALTERDEARAKLSALLDIDQHREKEREKCMIIIEEKIRSITDPALAEVEKYRRERDEALKSIDNWKAAMAVTIETKVGLNILLDEARAECKRLQESVRVEHERFLSTLYDLQNTDKRIAELEARLMNKDQQL
jgi:hypothetical protein